MAVWDWKRDRNSGFFTHDGRGYHDLCITIPLWGGLTCDLQSS